MQKPIRLKRPNLRIPFFVPPNAAPCSVSPGAHAPFPLPATTAFAALVRANNCVLMGRTFAETYNIFSIIIFRMLHSFRAGGQLKEDGRPKL